MDAGADRNLQTGTPADLGTDATSREKTCSDTGSWTLLARCRSDLAAQGAKAEDRTTNEQLDDRGSGSAANA